MYKDRDIEALGPLYIQHLDAMTIYGLHSKSDIAAELAWRDQRIEYLEALIKYIGDEGTHNGNELYPVGTDERGKVWCFQFSDSEVSFMDALEKEYKKEQEHD